MSIRNRRSFSTVERLKRPYYSIVPPPPCRPCPPVTSVSFDGLIRCLHTMGSTRFQMFFRNKRLAFHVSPFTTHVKLSPCHTFGPISQTHLWKHSHLILTLISIVSVTRRVGRQGKRCGGTGRGLGRTSVT